MTVRAGLVLVAMSGCVWGVACGDGAGSPAGGDVDVIDGAGDTADTSDSGDIAAADEGVDVAVDTSPETGADAAADAKVPVFIAQGHVGRTVMSCDDGQTWVYDRAYDSDADPHVCGQSTPVTCWSSGVPCDYLEVESDTCTTSSGDSCDCDHHPGAGTGIAYGDGVFVATFGWGPAGSLRRSANGRDWEIVAEGTSGLAGVSYGGDGFFYGAARYGQASVDSGATWQQAGEAAFTAPGGEAIWNARQSAFIEGGGGRIVVTAESGANHDVLVSADRAATWFRPDPLPAECGASARGIAEGHGAVVIVHGGGEVCVSTDAGDSFQLADVGGTVETTVVFDGTQFLAWTNGTRYASADGVTWTSTPTSPAGVIVGAVGVSPVTGTVVAIRGGWTNWYDKQVAYRSTDAGVTWTELPASTFTGGHPMNHVAFGWANPTPDCPLPAD